MRAWGPGSCRPLLREPRRPPQFPVVEPSVFRGVPTPSPCTGPGTPGSLAGDLLASAKRDPSRRGSGSGGAVCVEVVGRREGEGSAGAAGAPVASGAGVLAEPRFRIIPSWASQPVQAPGPARTGGGEWLGRRGGDGGRGKGPGERELRWLRRRRGPSARARAGGAGKGTGARGGPGFRAARYPIRCGRRTLAESGAKGRS